jgi:hypothetical protein
MRFDVGLLNEKTMDKIKPYSALAKQGLPLKRVVIVRAIVL